MSEASDSTTRTLTMKAALANLSGGPPYRWSSIADGLDGEVWPEVRPSFRVGSDETVFTIGSCFARNIEAHLATLGCRVPMLDFRLPAKEWHGPPTTALNKFSPGAFLQSLTWTQAVHESGGVVSWEHCAPLAIDCGGDQVFDVELASQTTVTRQRFLERRQQIYDVFREAFSADTVMMTPGLVEAWRDLETGLWIQGPASRHVLSKPERFRLEVIGYEQALAEMLAAIDLVRAHNPAAKIVLTVSPVPLTQTFSGRDVRIANAYSKAVLRAVCDVAAASRDRVDYFPSFESVTLSAPEEVWDTDRVHVRQAFIGKIVARFAEIYIDDAAPNARLLASAVTALEDGKPEVAAELAQRVIDAEPDRREAWLVLADGLIAAGGAARAQQVIGLAQERWPNAAALRFRLARALQGQGLKSRAMDEATRASAAEDAELTDLIWAARMLRIRRPDDSERIGRDLISRFPQHSEAYQPLIRLLDETGRREELRETLMVVTGLVKRDAGSLLRLAEILAEDGRAYEARRLVSECLDIAPYSERAQALKARLWGEAAAKVG